jgi:hypothetical protein
LAYEIQKYLKRKQFYYRYRYSIIRIKNLLLKEFFFFNGINNFKALQAFLKYR